MEVVVCQVLLIEELGQLAECLLMLFFVAEQNLNPEGVMPTSGHSDPRHILPTDLSGHSLFSMSKTMAEQAYGRYNLPHSSKEALAQLQGKLLYHAYVCN